MTVSIETLEPGIEEDAEDYKNWEGETFGSSVLIVTGGVCLKEVPACGIRVRLIEELVRLGSLISSRRRMRLNGRHNEILL